MADAWWDAIEPNVRELARRCCAAEGSNPDNMVILYDPARTCTPDGIAYFIDSAARPLWTAWERTARLALAQRDAMEEAEASGEGKPADPAQEEALINTFSDDPNEQWKRDLGLDSSGA